MQNQPTRTETCEKLPSPDKSSELLLEVIRGYSSIAGPQEIARFNVCPAELDVNSSYISDIFTMDRITTPLVKSGFEEHSTKFDLECSNLQVLFGLTSSEHMASILDTIHRLNKAVSEAAVLLKAAAMRLEIRRVDQTSTHTPAYWHFDSCDNQLEMVVLTTTLAAFDSGGKAINSADFESRKAGLQYIELSGKRKMIQSLLQKCQSDEEFEILLQDFANQPSSRIAGLGLQEAALFWGKPRKGLLHRPGYCADSNGSITRIVFLGRLLFAQG